MKTFDVKETGPIAKKVDEIKPNKSKVAPAPIAQPLPSNFPLPTIIYILLKMD